MTTSYPELPRSRGSHLSSFPAIAGLAERHEALRQAAALPGADPGALLDAAFAELDGAIELLTSWSPDDGDATAEQAAPDNLTAERRLLRAVFQHAPVPLLVLEQDGTVRRANGAAGELIGSPPGYATGRPLTGFVDLPYRAVVQSQLAAVARTGKARRRACSILGASGPAPATLTAGRFELPDGQMLIAATLLAKEDGPQEPPAARNGVRSQSQGVPPPETPWEPAGDHALRAMTRRMDMVTAVTRLLLDNSTFSEAVTLQRCARLLAGEMATWVIVDVERADRLRRQFVVGPHDEAQEELARTARAVDPQAGTVPAQVHSAGRSVVLAHADDPGILGTTPDGTPLLMLLGVTSLLSVPISDGA